MEVHFCPSAFVKRGGGGGGGGGAETENEKMFHYAVRMRTVYVKNWITFVHISLI